MTKVQFLVGRSTIIFAAICLFVAPNPARSEDGVLQVTCTSADDAPQGAVFIRLCSFLNGPVEVTCESNAADHTFQTAAGASSTITLERGETTAARVVMSDAADATVIEGAILTCTPAGAEIAAVTYTFGASCDIVDEPVCPDAALQIACNPASEGAFRMRLCSYHTGDVEVACDSSVDTHTFDTAADGHTEKTYTLTRGAPQTDAALTTLDSDLVGAILTCTPAVAEIAAVAYTFPASCETSEDIVCGTTTTSTTTSTANVTVVEEEETTTTTSQGMTALIDHAAPASLTISPFILATLLSTAFSFA